MTNRISLYVTSEHSRPLLLPWLQFVLIHDVLKQVGHYYNYLTLNTIPKKLARTFETTFLSHLSPDPLQVLVY